MAQEFMTTVEPDYAWDRSNDMEHELRELGKRLMRQMHDEYESDEELTVSEVMDGMNAIEQLAVLYVTGEVGEAFERVADEVGECIVTNQYWFKD